MPRIVTWTRFRDRITGITFQVFNTRHDDTGTEARKRSSDLLLRRIRESRKNDGEELILADDFNALQDEEAYTILTAPDSPMRDTRPASESGGTFCGFDVSNGPLPAIDYIFITDGWTEPDCQIIRDNDGTYNPPITFRSWFSCGIDRTERLERCFLGQCSAPHLVLPWIMKRELPRVSGSF